MRRLDFRNIADTTEMNHSLRLRPSMHPFVTALPSTSPSLPFWRPSLIPQFATRCNWGCAKSRVVMWKANKVSRQTSGQSTRVWLPKGSRWQQLQSTGASPVERTAFSCTLPQPTAGPFLPRFYPAFTLIAPINSFYPLFTPGFTLFWEGKMCRGKKEGKNGVNSFYSGVKPG